jgi:hypothetical protein
MASSIINSDDGVISGTTGLKSVGGDDGVLNIQSNGSTVVAVDGSGVSVTGTLSSSGGYGAVSATTLTVNSNNISADNSLGFRNRIINGDCRIAQRGTAAVTVSGSFPVDRFIVGMATDGAFSAQQDSSAPAGFVNSVKVTTTTADATLTTTQNLNCQQRIEGTNLADLGWGTANAKTVTLSFWVRSSLTGTFGGAIANGAFNRSYPFTYSISTADTWEQKSVTIPGDTSGTWLTDTGVGIFLFFGLGAGPDRSGTAGAWAGASYISATGAVSVIGTLNATWFITGVQLEVGSVATPFERRDYGRELIMCQRYLPAFNLSNTEVLPAIVNITSTSAGYGIVNFSVIARVPPTAIGVSAVGDFNLNVLGVANSVCTDISFNSTSSAYAGTFVVTGTGAPYTVNQAAFLRCNGTSARLLFLGCEL